MLHNFALFKQYTSFRINSYSEYSCQHLFFAPSQCFRILALCDCVQVDNAEDEFCSGKRRGLDIDPLSKSAEVVAEMGDARRLDTRKDDL